MNRAVSIAAPMIAGLVLVGGIASAQNWRHNAQFSAQDRQFVRQAAQANQAEIQEAQLALNNGAGERVKTFAQRMIDDHTRAGNRLQEIASRIGATLPDRPSEEQRGDLDRLRNLNGTAFDRTYMRHELADHQQAIALFQTEASNGNNPELRRFARQTLPTLRMHLQMARNTRGTWRAHRAMRDMDMDNR